MPARSRLYRYARAAAFIPLLRREGREPNPAGTKLIRPLAVCGAKIRYRFTLRHPVLKLRPPLLHRQSPHRSASVATSDKDTGIAHARPDPRIRFRFLRSPRALERSTPRKGDMVVPRPGVRGCCRLCRSRELRDEHPGRVGGRLYAWSGSSWRRTSPRWPSSSSRRSSGWSPAETCPSTSGNARHGGSSSGVARRRGRRNGDRPRRVAWRGARIAAADRHPALPGDDYRRRRGRSSCSRSSAGVCPSSRPSSRL